MPLIRNVSALLALLAVSACDRGPKPFRMTVDDVQLFQGFVLRGLGVGGTVEQGCIANFDAFVVKRDGKVIYEEEASIMSLDGLSATEADAGHEAVFYLFGAAEGTVAVGDTIEAEVTTCGKDDEEQ